MWIELLIFCILIGILIYLFKLYLAANDDYWPKQGVKVVLSKDVGTFWDLITKKKTMVAMEKGIYEKLKDVKFGGMMEFRKPVLLITDLDLIKQVLVKDFDYFVDRRKATTKQEPILDNMLVSLHGQKWKDVRSILSPTFTTGKIRRMFEHFNKSGKEMLVWVKSKPESNEGGHIIIIQELVSRFTVDVIGSTAFGMDTKALKDPNSIFYKMAKKVSDISTYRLFKGFFSLFFPRLFKMLGLKVFDQDVMEFFTGILSQALKNRESSTENRDDFLQLMIEARKGELKHDESELDTFEKDALLSPSTNAEDKKKPKTILTDDLVMAQCFLFFIAGFDTVGGVVNFAAYLMAIHQDMQERLHQEVKTAIEASAKGEIEYDSIGRLEYLDMFLSEILRCYPPATRTERQCVRDYKIPGTDFTITKDRLVTIPIQGIHQDEAYYPNPEKFDPERFSAENKANRHSFAYMPFGMGPRNCIAMRFALMESKVAIAYFAYYFLIEPTAKTPIPVALDKTAGVNRPVAELELKMTVRQLT